MLFFIFLAQVFSGDFGQSKPDAAGLLLDMAPHCMGALLRKNLLITLAECVKDEGDYQVLYKHGRGSYTGEIESITNSTNPEGVNLAAIKFKTEEDRLTDVILQPMPQDETNVFYEIQGWKRMIQDRRAFYTLAPFYIRMYYNQDTCDEIDGYDRTEHICASIFENYQTDNLCQGDKGTPLFVRSSAGANLVGLFLNSTSCNDLAAKNIFERVAPHTEWINSLE